MSEAREDRDERADDDVVYWYSFSNHYTKRAFGGATMLQPLMLRLTRKAAAFAAARPTLLFKPL